MSDQPIRWCNFAEKENSLGSPQTVVVCSQREVEKKVGILRQFAAGFTDYRNTDLIEHRVEELVAQRVYSLALGYEDLNDYGELRNDPLLAVLVEKGKAEIAKEM